MKKRWFLVVFLCLCYAISYSQNEGRPLITNFSPLAYNAGSFNKMILQDQRGVMYIVNSKGILEYDGNIWRTLPIDNYTYQGAIAKDSSGVIYASNNNDFGYLDIDENGSIYFKSLMDLLVGESKDDVSYIKHILTTSHGIYFITIHSFYRFFDGAIKKIVGTNNFFHIGYTVNDKIYVLENQRGICELVKNEFQLIPGGELFKNDRLYAFFPLNKNEIFIGTRNNGLFIYNTSVKNNTNAITRGFYDAEKFLKKNQLIHGIKTSDGQIVLSTIQNGIIILNKEGKISKHINMKSGLIDNFVRFLYEDNQKNLWLAASNGISKITLNSSLTVWDKHNGLKGKILKIIKPNNQLHVLTSNGIFKLEKMTPIQLDDIGSYTWDVIPLDSKSKTKILAANNIGLFEYNNFKANKVTTIKGALSLCTKPNNSYIIYVGKQDGLSVIQKTNNKWLEKGSIKGINKWVVSMQFDKDGNLWLSTNLGNIIKLKFNKKADLMPKEIIWYNEVNNTPEAYKVRILKHENKILFATEKGLYKYDNTKEFFSHYEDQILTGSQKEIFGLVKTNENIFWAFGSHTQKGGVRLIEKDENVWHHTTLNLLPSMEIESIYPDKNQVTWIGGSEGLFRYNKKNENNIDYIFNALIRKVTINRDSILFNGSHHKEISTLYGDRKVLIAKSLKNEPIELSNKYNSLKFEFTATNYHYESQTKFQYLLDGYDEQWSEWTYLSSKEYTNLPYGYYKFRVKAMSFTGKISDETAYNFRIKTPFYATVWSLFLYAIIIGFVIKEVIKYNTKKIRKEKDVLEETIKLRTAEVVQQKEEIEAQAEKLYKSNIQIISQRDRIEQSYKDIHLLSEIGNQIIANLDINKIVETVYERVNALMDATEFGIGICNKKKGTLTFRNYMYEGNVVPELIIPLSIEDRLSVQCVKYGKEIILGDIKQEYKQYIKTLDHYKPDDLLCSVICMPLIIKEEIIGMIAIQSHNINAYHNYHLNILKTLALYTAIAIDNANTFAKLEESYAELKELNEFKEAMTSMIVHDFKNALNTVINYSEFSSVTEKKLKSINQSGRHMLNMVLNMLDIQKFEEATLKLSIEKNNINKVIRKTINQVNFLVDQKSIKLTDNSTQVFYSKFDNDIILRVIENILTNAIKYTPNNGFIHIETKEENANLKVLISDSGSGIPEDMTKAVFEKFFQVQDQKNEKVHSSGLGLTFCKIAIEAHDGKIGVSSTLGQGSTFWFTLPLHSKEAITKEDKNREVNFSIPNDFKINLSKNDKLILQPILSDLIELDVYYYSDVIDLLNQVDFSNSKALLSWKEALEDTLTNINEEKFLMLIDMVKN